jgi:hypothetical protein
MCVCVCVCVCVCMYVCECVCVCVCVYDTLIIYYVTKRDLFLIYSEPKVKVRILLKS